MQIFSVVAQLFLLCSSLMISSSLYAEQKSTDQSEVQNNSLDPWEPFNRRVFQFNEVLDSYLIRPAAKAYVRITPNKIERGIGRFFNNLGEPTTFANELLQAKWIPAAQTGGRFLVNSTVGLLGFIDVATHLGLTNYEEDFGQTLGYWGIASGPYLVLPIIGPSSARDAAGLVPQYFVTDPTIQTPDAVRYSLYAVNVVQARAKLLSVDSVGSGDKYTFIRDVYLQRRQFFIEDGQVQDEFLDSSW